MDPRPYPCALLMRRHFLRQRIQRAVLGSTMNSGVLSSAKCSLRSCGQLIDPHHPTSDFQLLPHLKSARTSSLAKIVRPMPMVALVGRMTCKVGMRFVLEPLYGSCRSASNRRCSPCPKAADLPQTQRAFIAFQHTFAEGFQHGFRVRWFASECVNVESGC